MDAEAAERRKCEKCVNHHEIVCNKRRRGKRKNNCRILEIRAKSFWKTEKENAEFTGFCLESACSRR